MSDDTRRWPVPAKLGSRLREPQGRKTERLYIGDLKRDVAINSDGTGRLSGKRVGLKRGSGHL